MVAIGHRVFQVYTPTSPTPSSSEKSGGIGEPNQKAQTPELDHRRNLGQQEFSCLFEVNDGEVYLS